MPRRSKPDPLALAVGKRIKQLRLEAGLTLEKLAYESRLNSKGHLSNLERGLARPNVNTLAVLAERLEVLPLDLLTFRSHDDRQALIDQTRHVSTATLHRLARDVIADLTRLRAAEKTTTYQRPKRR